MENNQLEEIKKLTKENSGAIHLLAEDMAKIKRYMRIRMIINIVWIIIVVLPAVVALIYLPSFISNYIGNVSDWMETVGNLY
jgi:hypothetical protein